MARLTGPLFSLRASGSIADTLTFASWKGIQYVRTRVVPANPNTTDQQEVRGVFSTLNEMWKRMPLMARRPFTLAVRGLPLTARNKHIQVNVPVLIGEADLANLVMSVSTGSAIPPASAESDEAVPGTIDITCVAPVEPEGYRLAYFFGAAVQEGDPSPVLIRPTYVGFVALPGLVVDIIVPVPSVTYQWGVWCSYSRLSDGKDFISTAVRGTQAVA